MEELKMETAKKTVKRKSKLLPLLLVMLILVLCGGGYWYWDTNMNTPPPQLQSRVPAKSKAVKKKTEEKKQEPAASNMPVVPEFGNLREYAQLDAEASILQKKKEVAALQMEIAKIQGEDTQKKGSKGNELSASDIQALVTQEVGRATRATQNTRLMQNLEQLPVVFISIEGVGNSISARVRELNGVPVTLKPGSAFRGGRVASISRNGIVVNINGKRVFYPFQS